MPKPNKCIECGREFINEGCESCFDNLLGDCGCNDCYGYAVNGCGKEITQKGFVFR